jgi:hypothetical protein
MGILLSVWYGRNATTFSERQIIWGGGRAFSSIT